MRDEILERRSKLWLVMWIMVVLGLVNGAVSPASGDDSLCARVKIEINQEATLERQAFDAHMRINNGLSDISLENVDIQVRITDQDGNPVAVTSSGSDQGALFFLGAPTMDNIDSISGFGSVSPSTSADINWLIIPAPGAAAGVAGGTPYYVGAVLTYTIGGEEHVTEVAPDFIVVKPMPELVLDYFIPHFVYGDEPGTSEIEAPVPFPLGVRVLNNGAGTAKSLKIESAEPRIVENDGLPIAFSIESAEVNGQLSDRSLICDFGNIAAGGVAIGRWVMSCSISGEFVSFDASYHHADELGGEVTSLMTTPQTHLLVGEVLADTPGSDTRKDFLALDGNIYRLYGSDGVDTVVSDLSSAATLTQVAGNTAAWVLTLPAMSGPGFARIADPFAGGKVLDRVIRHDGKIIKQENAWLSRSRGEGTSWDPWLNFFDINGGGNYTVYFADASAQPQAPVLQFIPDRSALEGSTVAFVVESSDPNGTIPILSAQSLPPGAVFSDGENGTGTFTWVTSVGQAGVYSISFNASDGSLTATQTAKVTLFPLEDSDGDGLNDQWEQDNFDSLDRDGSGDFDEDGIPDALEFRLGSNPTRTDNAPWIPEIIAPQYGERTDMLRPSLVVGEVEDPDGDTVTYEFELFADEYLREAIAAAQGVTGNGSQAQWLVPEDLEEDHSYVWRVRATDGVAFSRWRYGAFKVNTENLAPGTVKLSLPANEGAVATRQPVFEAGNSLDPDGDALTYHFEVYADDALTQLIEASEALVAGTSGTTQWTMSTASLEDLSTYYWRVGVVDESGLESWSSVGSFTVDMFNQPPNAPVIAAPEVGGRSVTSDVELWAQGGSDPEGAPLVYYFEIDREANFSTEALQVSAGIPAQSEGAVWQVTGLEENALYHWRVKVSDGMQESPWVTGSFRIDAANEAPLEPKLMNPGHLAWEGSLTPVLESAPASDPEKDNLTYHFELYGDEELTTPLVQASSAQPRFELTAPLADNSLYYWRVLAMDANGLQSTWSDTGRFLVRFVDDRPEIARVAVATDSGIALSGLRVYAFTGTSSFTGLSMTTDENGIAEFTASTFAPGEYLFRADYLGQQFWSDTVELPRFTEVPLQIPVSLVQVEVATHSGPTAGVRVYLFSESGSYLGVSALTDQYGCINLSLPVGYRYKFRADLLGSQYWTEVIEISATEPNFTQFEFGGGLYTVSVKKDAVTPLTGYNAYLFNSNNSYLGLNAKTDSNGEVAFNVTGGDYHLRVDYLGYQFWSEVVTVAADLEDELIIPHQDVGILANAEFQGVLEPLTDVNTYLFSNAGSYMGVSMKTDSEGYVVLNLPEKDYKLRLDYLGRQYWSDAFVWADTEIRVPMAEAEVTVSWGGEALAGLPVYVFSPAGSYLGRTGTTAADKGVVFRLPEGEYRFRADYQGSQFWSNDVPLYADQQTAVDISTGGGSFSLTVKTDTDEPLPGINCYLFGITGSYLGEYGPADSSGTVSFDLSDGSYRFRADYLGGQFWSSDFTVPDLLDMSLTIPHHQSVATVSTQLGGDQQLLENVPVYLFSSQGSYLGIKQNTDAAGSVSFNLPQLDYKVRVDYLGQQFWSETFNSADTAVVIGEGLARITVSDSAGALSGVRVYVFTATNSYLGLNAVSDRQGAVEFRLPAGEYRFRADYLSSQYWGSATVVADQTTAAGIETGGGTFALTVDNGDGPLVGCRVYAFNPAGSYLGLQSVSDDAGQVSFNLSDGQYRFRADYLGYQYWTPDFAVPAVSSGLLSIPHQDIQVQVSAQYPTAETLAGVPVYLFTPAGSYQGVKIDTDGTGIAVFHLPQKEYKVRADYLRAQYWSQVFQAEDVAVTIPRGEVQLTVTLAETPVEGASVYVFNESSSYLGLTGTTDSSGQIDFVLPAGVYRLRVNYGGQEYWSDLETVEANVAGDLSVPLD